MTAPRRVAAILWAVCWAHGLGAALCFRADETALGGFLLAVAVLTVLSIPFVPLMWMNGGDE
jgi:hypothetical protein